MAADFLRVVRVFRGFILEIVVTYGTIAAQPVRGGMPVPARRGVCAHVPAPLPSSEIGQLL